MIRTLRAPALALTLALAAALPAPRADARPARLEGWPAPAARALQRVLARPAAADDFVVFDADNTLWQGDLEEALLPYLEGKGVLTPARLPEALRPVPLRAGESLFAYYERLCEVDDNVCYLWIAQAFSGLSLGELAGHVHALFAGSGPIATTRWEGGRLVSATVPRPRVYPAQRALLAALRDRGYRVFVVTAALEELVRMVVSDPRYGLDVPPANVVGVTLLLQDPRTKDVTTARKEIGEGRLGDAPWPADRARLVLTPHLWAPATWYEGKLAGILAYIDPVQRPRLVAGDAMSDLPMLFHVDVRRGVRLWVDRKPGSTSRVVKAAKARAEAQRRARQRAGADKGWVVVTPAQLGGEAPAP